MHILNKVICFKTTLLQFAQQGEKTGWTYIAITEEAAQQLKPGNKKSFRVKGKLDDYPISRVALMPMGDGRFIMAINAEMRKGIKKNKGAVVTVTIEVDPGEIEPPAELMECMLDEPEALAFYKTLAKSHQLYFTKWIISAKTDETKTKRIAHAVNAFTKKQGYAEMMRTIKKDREELFGL